MLTKEQITAYKPQCILHLNEQLPEILLTYYDDMSVLSRDMALAEFILDWNFEDSMYGHYGIRNNDKGLWEATEDWLNDWAERIEEISEGALEQMKQACTFIIMTQVEIEEEEMAQC